jgi:hypothetical protein
VLGARTLCKALRAAECFAWSIDGIFAVQTASETIPRDAAMSLDDYPASTGWWWFDTQVAFGSDNASALAWCPDNEQNWIRLWVLRQAPDIVGHDSPFPAIMFRLNSDVTVEAMIEAAIRADTDENRNDGLEIAAVMRFLIAASAWLRQRIIVMSDGNIARHRRRQIERDFGALVSSVKVIQLRRSESRQSESAQSEESAEWSCRWIVNGHWRNQYHPSDGHHELKYILPYVKGPDDKPLKVPTHTVYFVNR